MLFCCEWGEGLGCTVREIKVLEHKKTGKKKSANHVGIWNTVWHRMPNSHCMENGLFLQAPPEGPPPELVIPAGTPRSSIVTHQHCSNRLTSAVGRKLNFRRPADHSLARVFSPTGTSLEQSGKHPGVENGHRMDYHARETCHGQGSLVGAEPGV